VYLYRAVDKAGQTVDFFLSRNRDINAAKSFLRSAVKNTRVPTKITLDAYAASHRAVREMKEDGELPRRVKVRSSQYLNNLVEQDHRRVKQRIRPMLGFKLRPRGGNDFRDRVGGEDQKRTIQDGQAGRPKGDDVGVVERGTRCLSSAKRSPTELPVGLSLHQSLLPYVCLFWGASSKPLTRRTLRVRAVWATESVKHSDSRTYLATIDFRLVVTGIRRPAVLRLSRQ